jgi:5'-3' exonuclease
MATVYLVDASPYIFRSYFSLPATITDPGGRSVAAVYGFAGFLIKLVEDEQPKHLAIAFDGSLTSSFRNEIYPAYKAQRELPPPELESQLDDCRELAAAFGAVTFIDRRYEADDLIGTLCRSLIAARHRVVVVSSDKDLCQLVGDQVVFLDFARGERYDSDRVRWKFGVRPAQIPDFLGLAGDAVDNIPGIRGIGKKTAAALLAEFTDLEAIYEGLARVAELPLRGARSLAARLEAGRPQAFLSRRLATLAEDAPAAAGLEELAFDGADRRTVERLFSRLGFQGLIERIGRWAPG